jgi:phage shock protein A
MQDDFDLEGLSTQEAKAYVARFITTQIQITRDRSEAEEKLELWKKRVRLAMEKGENDLAKESLERAEEAHAKVVSLKSEEKEMTFKVEELKRRLAKIRLQPAVSINAEVLLDQLEGIVGTDHETSDTVADAEAQVALEALKKKMESESGE